MDRRAKQRDQRCDVERPLPKRASDPIARWELYFLYEPFDGANGTYDRATDLRMLAFDADDSLKRALRSEVAVEEP